MSKNDENVKEREINAFVFFADIRGWGSFLRRSSHYESEVYPLWRKWESLIDGLQSKAGWNIKMAGDGVLCIFEVKKRDAPRHAVDLLNEIWTFLSDCKSMLKKKASPRPDGIRVAGIYGIIFKGRKDWFGDKINVCERMTRQWRGKCCLIHETWRELIPRSACRQNGFVFSKVGRDPNVQIESIYERDMEGNSFFRKIKRKHGSANKTGR